MENQRTSVNTLGEFGLIDHLTSKIKINNASTQVGVGDDAAVLNHQQKQLVTTDLLLEGIHFDLIYTPFKHLGYKAAITNFSDIYAMNGKPTQLLVALGISARFSVEELDELYRGIYLACKQYGVDLVGGDISASMTGLTISMTCVGEATQAPLVYRSGAQLNDLICVTGNLGAAYMGLQLLEREKTVINDDEGLEPDFEGYDYILERQLKPEARKDIIELFQKENILPTSMIDVSDGLASDLLHLCKSSRMGARIFEEKIPIDYQTASMAEVFNMNLTTAALNGGEDFELLFTAPLNLHDQLAELKDITIIGHVCEAKFGCMLITRGDQQEIEITAPGWVKES